MNSPIDFFGGGEGKERGKIPKNKRRKLLFHFSSISPLSQP
jgi:hypothetical protein